MSEPLDRHQPDASADPIAAERPSDEAIAVQELGSASRSCLVILAMAAAILLLICVSWLVRLLG